MTHLRELSGGLSELGRLTQTEHAWWLKMEGAPKRAAKSDGAREVKAGVKRDECSDKSDQLTTAFVSFIEKVRCFNVVLGEPPRWIGPSDIRGAHALSCMQYALEHCDSRYRQQQVDLLPDLPLSLPEIQQQFAHRRPFAVRGERTCFNQDPVSLEQLLSQSQQLLGYDHLKALSLEFLMERQANVCIVSYVLFLESLEMAQSKDALHTSYFSNNEKMALLAIISVAVEQSLLEPHGARVNHPIAKPIADVDLANLLQHALQFKNKEDSSHFFSWFDYRWLLHNPVIALSEYNDLLGLYFEVTDALATEQLEDCISLSETMTFSELNRALRTIQQQQFIDQYPEKPLCEVLKAFTACASAVDCHFNEALIAMMERDYGYIQAQLHVLAPLSDSSVQTLVSEISIEAVSGVLSHDRQLMLLAILREAVRRVFGILPYNTQMLALLGVMQQTLYDTSETSITSMTGVSDVLKGHIAQVNTGEGKSTLIAMQAAYFALQGRYVDVISSSRSLAQRDQQQYQVFYDYFNIKSSHICTQHPDATHFQGKIIYGVNYDFEFSVLRRGLQNDRSRDTQNERGQIRDRPHDVAIIDEVDNLLIDKGSQPAVISVQGTDPYLPLIHPILAYVQQSNSMHDAERRSKDLQTVRSYMTSGDFDTEAVVIKDIIQTVSDDTLRLWLDACLTALFKRQFNLDYVIRQPDAEEIAYRSRCPDRILTIVDRDTGQLSKGSRWHDRVHQFLEAKHQIPIVSEQLSAASIIHSVFFNQYQNIYGFTGTLGSTTEQREMGQTHQLGTLVVPPHLNNQRQQLPTKIYATTEQQFAAIATAVATIHQQNRASLILVETIVHSQALSHFFDCQGIKHHVLNAIQPKKESFIVAKAGLPGSVTIATNAAGRGTDIRLANEVVQSGGLHVVVGFYPANIRVENQGFGRAARQGQPGSCQMLLSLQSLPIAEDVHGIEGLGEHGLLTLLGKNRDREQLLWQLQRGHIAQREQIRFQFLGKFFDKMSGWYASIDHDCLAGIAEGLLGIEADDLKEMDHVMAFNKIIDKDLLGELHDLMQNRQSSGEFKEKCVAWLKLYKAHIEADILELWAQFYNGLNFSSRQHQGESNLKSYEAVLEDQYRIFMNDMAEIFVEPRFAFNALVKALVGRESIL